MYPILFRIPIFGATVTIYTYGFMVAVAFVVGMIWVSRESRRVGQDPAKAMDLAFYMIVAAIVGSRILHVLVSERERFFQNPLILFKIWEGGLVFYGGLIACLLVAVWYIRRHRLPMWTTCDIFAPGIALGHVFGRLGCLMAGCCYGRTAIGSWCAITFPNNPSSFAPTGIPLYPTQLMEASGEFVIFWILFFLRKYKKFEGQLIATYLIAYAILRSVVEYFRGDVDRGFLIEPWISTSQFISLVMLTLGVVIYVVRWKKKESAQ